MVYLEGNRAWVELRNRKGLAILFTRNLYVINREFPDTKAPTRGMVICLKIFPFLCTSKIRAAVYPFFGQTGLKFEDCWQPMRCLLFRLANEKRDLGWNYELAPPSDEIIQTSEKRLKMI